MKRPPYDPDFDPGNGQGYWSWWGGEDGAWKWIPPKPDDFPGRQREWVAFTIYGLPPSLTDDRRPPLSVNQAHTLHHPGEKLTNSQYGALWSLAAGIAVIVFLGLVPQATTGGIVFLVAIAFVIFTGVFAVFARRHPYIAAGMAAAAWWSSRHDNTSTPPTNFGGDDYSGPAGFS